MEEVETDINLHDLRLINVEQSVTENQNDIDCINIVLSCLFFSSLKFPSGEYNRTVFTRKQSTI